MFIKIFLKNILIYSLYFERLNYLNQIIKLRKKWDKFIFTHAYIITFL